MAIGDVYHNGSLLLIARETGALVLADDLTFTEACEYMLEQSKVDPRISPVVRKTLRKRSQPGWPKV